MKTASVVRLLTLIAISFCFSNFSKCKKGGEDGTLDPSKNYAKVRFFHAATDAIKLALVADGKTLNPDSTAYNNGTDYYNVEVNSKATKLNVSAKGATLNNDSIVLKTDTDIAYSFFAFQEADKAIKSTILIDNLVPATAGKARVRIAHFVPDLSNLLDVEFAAPDAAPSTKRDFQNLTFRSVTNFIEVAAGSYDVKVKLGGQTLSVIPAPNAKGVNVSLTAGKIYTLVLRGYVNRTNSAGLTVVTNK